MHLGDLIEGNKPIPVANTRPAEPLLIIGRDRAIETLRRLFLDDVHEGRGATFFGDATEILKNIPTERIKDTIIFTLDYEHPRSFNPLATVPESQRSEIAEYIVDAFSVAYPSNIPTALLDNNLLAASLAMLSVEDGTLYAARHLFTSDKYRARLISKLDDPDLKNVWEVFDELEPREQRQQAQSILNRLLPLTTDPWYRNILAQTKSFTLRPTDILLVDLPDTRKGTVLAALVMARTTGRIYIQRPRIFVGGGLPVLACRYLDELPDKLRTELIGTATIVSFRLGVKDARILEPEFNLRPQEFSLTELPSDRAYVRLEETVLITIPESGRPSYPPSPRKIINRSRAEFSVARKVIERKVANFIKTLGGDNG